MTKKGKRNIKLLGSSSLFNDISSEMITPILPFYITALGGGGVSVGLISGLREGLSSLFKFLGGWASDKTKKRMPFVFFGYLFSIISRFLLLLAKSWQAVTIFISFERFGKMRDPPRDAIITDSTNHRGKGFGLHQAMDTSGAIIGTLLVALLYWKLKLSFNSIILFAAIISVFSLLPLFFVKEHRKKTTKKMTLKGAKELHHGFKYFLLTVSIFTLANFGLYMFLILLAQKITNSILIPILLYALFSFSFAVFAFPAGSLSDKIGRKKLIMAGYLLFVVVSLGFTIASTIPLLILFFFLYGLVYALTQSNQRAFVSDIADPYKKGTAFGLYESVIGMVNIPAGLIAGLLWNYSINAMFYYTAGVSLFALLLMIFVKENNLQCK